MKDRAILEINLDLLKKNAVQLQSMTAQAFFCPMLKANAYGHGAVFAAQALYDVGVKQVGVLTSEEALPIKKLLPNMDVLIFKPLLSKEDLSWIAEKHLIPVCSNWIDLKNLGQLQKKIRIHLKFDTGFSRLGFKLDSIQKLLEFLKNNSQIKLEGVGSHLVSGEELWDKSSFSFSQLKKFLDLVKFFPNKKNHILNSPALISQFVHQSSSSPQKTQPLESPPDLQDLSFPQKQESDPASQTLSNAFDLGARPGISLYGIKTKVFFQNHKAKEKWNQLQLQAVSRLKSQIAALKDLEKGDSVSYGRHWTAPRKSKIAVVSLGYADGFFRALGKKREVLFRDQKTPVVGAVCMDFFMIDLTDIKGEKPIELGEEVIIFGKAKNSALPIEEQAAALNTIPYELFSSLGSRVKRVYIKN